MIAYETSIHQSSNYEGKNNIYYELISYNRQTYISLVIVLRKLLLLINFWVLLPSFINTESASTLRKS